MRNKTVRLLALFLYSLHWNWNHSSRYNFRQLHECQKSDYCKSGWIVTFLMIVRGCGPSTGYVLSGFFGGKCLIPLLWIAFSLGLTLGRVVLIEVTKKVIYYIVKLGWMVACDAGRSALLPFVTSTMAFKFGDWEFITFVRIPTPQFPPPNLSKFFQTQLKIFFRGLLLAMSIILGFAKSKAKKWRKFKSSLTWAQVEYSLNFRIG